MTDSKLVRLEDCPPGLFRFGKTIGFRSEYSSVTPANPNQPDAYVVASGEYFWGGCTTTEDRSDVMVEPIDIDTLSASSPPVGGSGEVMVKALEWDVVSYDPNWHYADSAGYRYSVFLHRSGKWRLVRKAGEHAPIRLGEFGNADEAKAAAYVDLNTAIRSALVAPVPNGVPEGAIVNGRTLIDRLEHHYQFACEGGSLAMCSEWQDLVRCFEHLADYAAASPVTPEGLSGGDGWIAWEGGDDPLPPKTRVEVRLRCDQYTIGPAVSFWWGRDDTDRTYDIVAYRLANPV